MARHSENPRIRYLICLAFFTAIVVLAFRTLVFQIFVVPSSSMVPTLLKGDTILVSKYAYGYSNIGSFRGLLPFKGRLGGHLPERGDVIVFAEPSNNHNYFVKRLIGLPGDHVQMRQGVLYINNMPVKHVRLTQLMSFPGDDEPTDDIIDYVEFVPRSDSLPDCEHLTRVIRGQESDPVLNNTSEIIVPPHSYFFMGDNRDMSNDSRRSELGFVPEENLTGQAQYLLFSLVPGTHLWEFTKWSWSMRKPRQFTRIY